MLHAKYAGSSEVGCTRTRQARTVGALLEILSAIGATFGLILVVVTKERCRGLAFRFDGKRRVLNRCSR